MAVAVMAEQVVLVAQWVEEPVACQQLALVQVVGVGMAPPVEL